MHEPGDKRVLGHRIKSGGEKEGREVLHILAHHPSTAKFISTKLAMRFVSDDPPPALIDRMTPDFLEEKRRHQRSAENHVPFAGILGA